MKKQIKKPKLQINQKELIERLKMPLNAIQSLKKNNTLKFEKVGRECFFDVESVEEFERSFNMKDYLTVSECKAKLDKLGYYTFKTRRFRIFISNLRIYITVKRLINGDGGNDIPNEYRLEAKRFGVTKYISRKSFAKTLRWLRNIDRRLHPILTKQQKQQREELAKQRYETVTQKRKEYIKKFYTGSIQFSPEQLRKRHGLRFQIPV
jgi:hypothetical protein